VIYNWSEYIDPEIYQMFFDEYGIQINEDNLQAAQEGLRLAEERYRVGAGTLRQPRVC